MALTDEQQAAIAARNKVMVSASAGAGKTTVMIKRLVDIVCEGNDLDNVLCVTFTKKAAAQMKDKLRSELVKRLNTTDEKLRKHLREQLGKINSADISTIDSFCSRLVKTYFYELQVDSSFEVVADEAERAELKEAAMSSLFDERYASGDEEFLFLLSKLKKKRSDKALRAMLSSAYERVRICPDYRQILENAMANTFTEKGFGEVCCKLKSVISEKLSVLTSAIDEFALKFNAPNNDPKFFKILDDIRSGICDYMNSAELFGAPKKLTTLRRPSGSSEEDLRFKEFVEKVKDKYKELTDFDEESERLRFFESGKVAVAFCNLLLAFDEAYSGVKRSEGKMDFGDLEQYSLRLLRGEDCDSDVRERINEKYKYVFVDEYQDVNPIQDYIISYASGDDVFCVGDVKQAIYGFRGSRSSFFSDKCESVESEGNYIILPDNFRSSTAVIDFVNKVFSKVMRVPLSTFDYSAGHAMRGGSRYGKGYEGVAQFCLFDDVRTDKEVADKVYSVAGEKVASRRSSSEALAVLKLVKEALNSTYYDPDSGREVKVELGDICVLTRKRSSPNVQEIIRTLSAEYPVASSAEVNVCTRPEIIKILDILSYLNNAEQDIPLASAMLSPLGGFCEDELVKIRLKFKGEEKLFYLAAKRYAEEVSDGLSAKLNAFYERVKRLRSLSDSIGAAKLIDEIMSGGGFATEFSSPVKLVYLRTLQRSAYGASGELSLNAFLQKIKASGNRICAPASVASDSINVMTMHASKGLEFPVVIVADLATSFKGNSSDNMPFDEYFGFAPKYYGEDRTSYNTLLRKLTAINTAKEELCNEINLLYVAFTRAKYSLYVLTSEAEPYNAINAAYADCYAPMIDFEGFDLRKLDLSGEEQKVREGSPVPVLDCPDAELLNILNRAAGFKYGFEQAITLPVKSSASRLLWERDNIEDAQPIFADEYEKVADGSDSTPETGIAYHRFLELCDFSVKDEAGVRGEVEKFLADGLIDKSQYELLDVKKLTAIVSMPVFDGVAGKSLYREREFLCKLPSLDYIALREGVNPEEACPDDRIKKVDDDCEKVTVNSDDGNSVIVQGAIDLLCVERVDGRAVKAHVIDYKYTARTEESVRQKYSPQLALYKKVVCKVYSLAAEDVKTTIVNIRACRQIDLDI
ncbi:MAG: UvrD-helicase domain-containing protein [Candidatus Coproplasma sp.]